MVSMKHSTDFYNYWGIFGMVLKIFVLGDIFRGGVKGLLQLPDKLVARHWSSG